MIPTVSARLARRDISAHKWRSLIAILIFALPVAFGVLLTSVLVTGHQAGSAPDAAYSKVMVEQNSDKADQALLTKHFPGVQFHPEVQVSDTAESNGITASIGIIALDSDLPEAPPAGHVRLAQGTAAALNAKVGDQVSIGNKSYTVDSLIYRSDSTVNLGDYLQKDWSAASSAEQSGLTWLTKDDIKQPGDGFAGTVVPPAPFAQAMATSSASVSWEVFKLALTSYWFVVVLSLALLLATFTISLTFPVFAIAQKRQSRSLELLANTGARPGLLRSVMLWQGALLAAAGGLVGLGLSWLVFAWLAPLMYPASDHFWLGGVGFIAVLGVTSCGVLAAAIPTVVGSKTRQPKFHLTMLIGPALLIAGNLLLKAEAVGELVPLSLPLLAIGVAATAPLVLYLVTSQAGRLSLTVRLAARDCHRNWLRTSAAVTAIAVTAFTLTCVGWLTSVLTDSNRVEPQAVWATSKAEASSPAGYAETLEQVGATVNATERTDVYTTPAYPASGLSASPWGDFHTYGDVIVNDGTILDRMTQIEPEAISKAKSALIDGKVVVFTKSGTAAAQMEFLEDHHDTRPDFRLSDGGPQRPPAVRTSLSAVGVPAGFEGIMMSRETADQAGFSTGYLGTLFLMDHKPGAVDTVRLAQMQPKSTMTIQGLGTTPLQQLVQPVVYLGGGLFIVFVAGLVISLASAESRRDLLTLQAVGASPRVASRFRVAQGALVLVTGGLLGVITGLAILL